MFSFFRRKPKPQPVPEWANFMTPEGYASFQAAVKLYFDGLGNPYTIDDGVVHTQWVPTGGGIQNMGLLNVAQMCARAKVEDHAEIVRGHFEMMRKSEDFMEVFFKQMDDFEFVRSFIGTRLYHPDHLNTPLKDNVIHHEIAEGIIALLVFDLPQTITSVQTKQMAVWGKTKDELFAIGLQNILENYNLDIVELDAGIPLKAVIQDHFFGGNIILHLDHEPELLGTHGTLVGVPHRHTTLLFPIENAEVLLAVQTMIPMIHGMFNEGPGSISPNLYWYHQGRFETIPFEVKDQESISISPPESFVALLNYISEEE